MNLWRTIWTHLWCCFSYQGQEEYSGLQENGLFFNPLVQVFVSGSVLSHLTPGFLSLIGGSGSLHTQEYTVHTNRKESMNPGSFSLKIKKSTMVEADFNPASDSVMALKMGLWFTHILTKWQNRKSWWSSLALVLRYLPFVPCSPSRDYHSTQPFNMKGPALTSVVSLQGHLSWKNTKVCQLLTPSLHTTQDNMSQWYKTLPLHCNIQTKVRH